MRIVLTSVLFIAALALAFPLAAQTAPSSSASGPHIEVELVSETDALVPGTTSYIALYMQPEHHWHTYWRNPGDSGEPPKVEWQTTPSLTIGEILWPLPAPIAVAHLVNYGYSESHLLMVPVDVPENLTTQQTFSITADVSWLVCQEDCIPGWATLSLNLPVAASSNLSSHAELFSKERSRLPNLNERQAKFEITDSHIALEVNSLDEGEWHIFPFRSDVASHSAPQQLIRSGESTQILLEKSDYFSGSPEQLSFLLSNGQQGFYLTALSTGAAPASSKQTLTVTEVLLYAAMALLGGLILNIMPCVLPILSIKALSLQHTEHSNRGHNWAYLGGVLVCFNVFAAIILAIQASGEQLGWGFHLQSPVVIALLAFLFTFIGLILLDVFYFGSGLSNLGNNLVVGNTGRSHFFTGLLAVIVASPCTAPFMAAALGIAFVQPPVIALIIFNALALGFALPLTLMFVWQGARKWLPKPGLWMETFKRALAFPMFATVAWLVWVFSAQTDSLGQLILLCALVSFAFFCWLHGQTKTKKPMSVLATLGIILSVFIVVLRPMTPQKLVANENTTAFDPKLVESLKADDQVVFVNLTADWCITCKVNEHVALSSDSVKQVIAKEKVHYLLGDWTNKNQTILAFLQQFDRAGVPLYVIYAGENYVKVLPQVLTPEIVVNNLNQALEELSHAN